MQYEIKEKKGDKRRGKIIKIANDKNKKRRKETNQTDLK